MIWGWLKGIGEQVLRYSSFPGQLWYVITFLFRLGVVVTLGSSVYGDEQGNFKCTDIQPGCQQVCYNQFTKMSHLRFWGFQLLCVITPIAGFHFLATYFAGQIKKIHDAEKRMEMEDNESGFRDEQERNYEAIKLRNRKKMIGKVKTKKFIAGGDLKEFPINDRLRLAYYIGALLRLVAEGAFLYLIYVLYNYPDYLCITLARGEKDVGNTGRVGVLADTSHCDPPTGLHFLWAQFPEHYVCEANKNYKTGFDVACSQVPVVSCWTSRPFEKTVFLRYMNILSAVCFCLCAIEMVLIPIQHAKHKSAKNRSRVHIVYRDAPGQAHDMVVMNHQLRSQPSNVYNTTHAHADYPSRTNSFYEEERDHRPQHPPPNDTQTKIYPSLQSSPEAKRKS